MRILDLERPYGTVHPPQPVPGSDRMLAYEQDNLRFDPQGNEIGLPGAEPATAPEPKAAPDMAQRIRQIEKLLAAADSTSADELYRKARLILGRETPRKRGEIIATLRAALALYRVQGVVAPAT